MPKCRIARKHGPRSRRAGALLLLSVVVCATAVSPQALTADDSDAAVLAQLTELRDAFVKRIGEEGYKICPAPQVELADPPSLARYVSERNSVSVAAWSHLTSTEKQGFEEMAQNMGGEASARSVFENGTNRWVFVHELGHWWQTCRHASQAHAYAQENGANRIALAFWRERDPRYAVGVVHGYRALLTAMPAPLPAGQSVASYFDTTFATMTPGDTSTWFQAKMIADLAEENPLPSFHKALSQPLYPY
jgi:hypothetical protein